MLRNSQQSAQPGTVPILRRDKAPSVNRDSPLSGRFFLLLTAYCLLLTVFIGCKKEEAAPPPAAAAKKAAAPVQAVMTTVKKEEYVYVAAGKRDPFKPFIELEKKEVSSKVASTTPMTPLQAYDLSELRLVGVIILPGKKVAMIEDPTGKGYNVKEGTLIGASDGKVVEIQKDEVVVEEKYRDEMGKTRTRKASIRIPREQGEEGR